MKWGIGNYCAIMHTSPIVMLSIFWEGHGMFPPQPFHQIGSGEGVGPRGKPCIWNVVLTGKKNNDHGSFERKNKSEEKRKENRESGKAMIRRGLQRAGV